MRAAFLLVLFASILIRTVGAPQAGVLGWTWLTLMQPQRLVWGFLESLQFNMILAVVTLLSWLFSREPKRPPLNLAIFLWLSFMAFVTFTTFFALSPVAAWARWDSTFKVMALGLFVATIMTNQLRIHALVWVTVLSLGYFGVKGGAFTLLTGGAGRVIGPIGSGLGDNNNLALALCALLPLINYLRLQSRHWIVRLGAGVAMGLDAVAVIGTFSRGGLLALFITGGYLWWRSRQKLVILLFAFIMIAPAIKYMPESWTARMQTIETANQDSSFQSRLAAWEFAIKIAIARPFTGGGFNASEEPAVFQYYNPGSVVVHWGLAAHSLYFQLLGDHGFIGLALYLGLVGTAWLYASRVHRRARLDPSLAWAVDLAAMIQVAIMSYMVGGAALSMAYYDLIFILISLSIALHQLIIVGELAEPVRRPSFLPRISGGSRTTAMAGNSRKDKFPDRFEVRQPER